MFIKSFFVKFLDYYNKDLRMKNIIFYKFQFLQVGKKIVIISALYFMQQNLVQKNLNNLQYLFQKVLKFYIRFTMTEGIYDFNKKYEANFLH